MKLYRGDKMETNVYGVNKLISVMKMFSPPTIWRWGGGGIALYQIL